MGRGRKSRTSRGGYTLVELMMVVMIIAMSTLAFAPGMSRAVTERRVSSVARELIRIGRRARADTFGYLRAHLIWIDPAAGRVQLLRGPNNSCRLAAWSAISADCPATASATLGQRCLENMFVSEITGDEPVAMRAEALSGTTASYSTTKRALCYAPNGVVYHGTGTSLALAATATTLSDANNASIAGGFVFSLNAGDADPAVTDRVHRVLFPLGSSARSLR